MVIGLIISIVSCDVDGDGARESVHFDVDHIGILLVHHLLFLLRAAQLQLLQ